MNTENCDYGELERVSYVFVDGDSIPLNDVEFLNIEEDIHGRDVITFNHNGQEYKSLVITKFY